MKQWFASPGSDVPLANSQHTWSGKLGVWMLLGALAVMFGLVSLLVFTTPLARNELGLLGGLRIAASDDTVLFVGDRRVGTGDVTVVWNELLGTAGRPPLAVEIDQKDLSDNDLVVILGGNEAELVWQTDGPTGAHRGRQNANFSFRQVLLYRDGVPDHLFVIQCQFPDSQGRWQHLLLPIRARRTGEAAMGYFPQAANQVGGNVNRGMIPSRRDHATFELKLSVNAGAPPSELADELANFTLWTPPAP